MTHDCFKNAVVRRVFYYDDAWRFDCDDGLQGVEIKFCPFCGLELGGVMKEEKEPQEEPVEPANEPKAPKQKSNQFTVTDQGEHGYDNDGPFGIGMIKGVK